MDDNDINNVIGKLTPNDLTQLYHALDLEDEDIERAKGDLSKTTAEVKAQNVLSFWKSRSTQKGTLGDILQALEQIKNIDHKEKLEKIWKGKARAL